MLKKFVTCLEILTQLTNAETVKLDVVIRVRTRDLIVVYEFIFNRLSFYLRQKINKL